MAVVRRRIMLTVTSSTFIGKYESDVKDEYYPYVRPQESGNHTDIRYFLDFQSASGKGITFEGYAPMEAERPFLILLRIWILVMKGEHAWDT